MEKQFRQIVPILDRDDLSAETKLSAALYESTLPPALLRRFARQCVVMVKAAAEVAVEAAEMLDDVSAVPAQEAAETAAAEAATRDALKASRSAVEAIGWAAWVSPPPGMAPQVAMEAAWEAAATDQVGMLKAMILGPSKRSRQHTPTSKTLEGGLR